MPMQLYGQRWSQIQVPAGGDQVLVGYPLPEGGRCNRIWLDCHVIGTSIPWDHAAVYGLAGFQVQLIDPDSSNNYEALWDAYVTKDTGLSGGAGGGIFDMNTGTGDGSPYLEIGEKNPAKLAQIGMGEVPFFEREKMITFASNPRGFQAEAPDSWIPTDHFNTEMRGLPEVDKPSLVLFGFSSPSLNATTTTVRANTYSTGKWLIYKYLETALMDAWKYYAGLIETGAETPYVEAVELLDDLIEPSAFEEIATSFDPETWIVFAKATFGVVVPGEPGNIVVSG